MTSLLHRPGLQSLYRVSIPQDLQRNLWPLIAGSLTLGILSWAIYDYRDWVGFGTGGIPPTIRGWFKANRLRIVRAFNYLCGDDLQGPSGLPQTEPRYLPPTLPQRAKGPPSLKPRTLPQRQCPEPIEPQARDVGSGTRLPHHISNVALRHYST